MFRLEMLAEKERAPQTLRESSGTLSCFWVSILPTIWHEVIGGFQA
jgi:hypothetical protein